MQLILLLMLMALMNKIFITGFLFFISFIQAEECVPEPNASVYFISPQDNYVSKSSEVKIVFGIKNFDQYRPHETASIILDYKPKLAGLRIAG